MFFPFHSTSKVSLVYLFPLQTSHVTHTSGKKFISSFIDPAPLQDSHLPPLTLKENCPGWYPRSLEITVAANRFLMCPNAPVYVAAFERGVLPIGD